MAASDDGGPACVLPFGRDTLLTRMIAQLRAYGVDRVVVLTRPTWRDVCRASVGPDVEVTAHPRLSDMLDRIANFADTAPSDLLIVHGDVVTHNGAVANLLADPRIGTGVLSSTDAVAGLLAPRLRITRGRVMACESAYHSVRVHNSSLLAMCKIGASDLGEAAVAARELADLTRWALPERWGDEFAWKVADRGATVLERNAGLAVLADQLADGPRPAGFPGPTELREQIADEYERRVALPAEALRDDPLPLLVVGLIRRDVMLTTAYLRRLHWDRPVSVADAEAAHDELAAVDEDAVQLSSAVKATDGFFTTFLVSTYSRYIARWAARHGLTPNQVTTASMLLGVLAALAFATGGNAGMVAGALLLQVAFTADCVDGQLARYTRQFSTLGAWLDSVFDRGKEYIVYAGLAIGAAARGDGEGIWLLAAAALALQTFRHFIDFSYAAQQHQALAVSVRHPVKSPDEGDVSRWEESIGDAEDSISVLQRLGRSGIRTSVAFERQPWRKWFKRIIVLPIGERFALISLAAAIAGPRTTFTWLLAWGLVAAVYTTTGRVLRSFA
ncbi:MAG TPA: CDP-alcohol phosphatidyltransferase family protein [Euzebyales bacterium]|nr:CDP-alcohol phosphatidyltransferase family protein [Euzebyales bacterium]